MDEAPTDVCVLCGTGNIANKNGKHRCKKKAMSLAFGTSQAMVIEEAESRLEGH